MGAAVVGLSATQVNILVNTIFASHVVGANTWLQMAFRLMQLPLGVFGVAIATVAGAGVAQRAAARDMPAVKATLGSAMRHVAFLNVPSAVGLAVLARPIISMIYEHGRFGPEDTAATAQALVFYAVGLYAYSGVKVFAPAFYALDEARVPVIGSVLGMASNVALNLALWPVLGFRGVALGTSLAAGVNFLVLALAWRRRHGGLGGAGIAAQLARVVPATAVLALVAWASQRGLPRLLVHDGSSASAPARARAPARRRGRRRLPRRCPLLGIAELTELLARCGAPRAPSPLSAARPGSRPVARARRPPDARPTPPSPPRGFGAPTRCLPCHEDLPTRARFEHGERRQRRGAGEARRGRHRAGHAGPDRGAARVRRGRGRGDPELRARAAVAAVAIAAGIGFVLGRLMSRT